MDLQGKLNKVAIVGTSPSSKMLAPYDDNSWDIWACSAGNVDQLPRVNIWFELHALVEMTGAEMKGVGLPLFKWLKDKSEEGAFDVVMLEAGTNNGGKLNKYVPKALPYPRDDMIETFGTRNWFTSSVAYMMALAIANGAKEIGLFGVDMAAGQEHYEAQRAGCVYWIELARSRGIEVSIPAESCLNAATPMYGYWEGTPFGRRINSTIALVKSSIAQAQASQAQAERTAHYFGGALEQLEYFKRTWADGEDMDADLGRFAPILDGVERALTEKLAAIPEAPAASVEGMSFSVPVDADGAKLRRVDWSMAPTPAKPNGHMPLVPAGGEGG